MSEQVTPKQQLVSLLNSCMAAAQSRDVNLIGFSTQALEGFLSEHEVVAVEKAAEGEQD